VDAGSFLCRESLRYFVGFEHQIIGQIENAKFAVISLLMLCGIFKGETRSHRAVSMHKAHSPKPKAQSEDGRRVPDENKLPTVSARVAALKMLARRELSEAQVRQRLARRGYEESEIDTAVERLKADRAIDDGRVANAIARTEVSIKRRGKRRVVQQIQQAGISRSAARQAVDETFEEIDEQALLSAALDRRLKGSRVIADDREFQRLFRYLVGQGFDADGVFRALSARRPR
jgi:regulatory protein